VDPGIFVVAVHADAIALLVEIQLGLPGGLLLCRGFFGNPSFYPETGYKVSVWSLYGVCILPPYFLPDSFAEA